MKSVFIIHGQGITAEIQELLDEMDIRGFTRWEDVMGRGSKTGEPRYGTHTWPALNNAIIVITEDEKVIPLLQKLKNLDQKMPKQGLKAFVWDVSAVM
jgi:nitrogen regulatory protein PII